VHLKAILCEPGTKLGSYAWRSVKKTLRMACASQYAAFAVNTSPEVPELTQEGYVRELADDRVERRPLLHGNTRGGVVHIAFHPGVDHVSDGEVIGGTHQVASRRHTVS